jgi:type IV pilus assembly protein PilX
MGTMPANERGYVIIAALMILALLTIIGVSASHISTTEVQIATNELLYERAFYTAEAGLSRLRQLLKTSYPLLSSGGAATSTNPDWSFALKTAEDTDEDGKGDAPGGVVWVDGELNSIRYRVVIWNNDDGGGPKSDRDGLLCAQSDAWGPRKERCRIETMLRISSGGESISEYAQEGAGPKKSYISDDLNAMQKDDLETSQVTGLY